MLGQFTTHANFSVDDLAKAKAFYVDKLGFTVKRESDSQLFLESGAGTHVNVYAKPDHKAWDSTVLGFEVDDVHDQVTQLTGQGVTIAKIEGSDDQGVVAVEGEGEAAWFQDPAGNWLCISNLG